MSRFQAGVPGGGRGRGRGVSWGRGRGGGPAPPYLQLEGRGHSTSISKVKEERKEERKPQVWGSPGKEGAILHQFRRLRRKERRKENLRYGVPG